MKLDKDEILLRESRGNCRLNSLGVFGWVGGRWFLTNLRIVFESNAFNIREREESIPLERITSIKRRYSDLISSKLVIFLDTDPAIELNVPNRKGWIDDIGKAMKALKKDTEHDWDIRSIINTQEVEKPPGWYKNVAIQLIIYAICVGILIYILL